MKEKGYDKLFCMILFFALLIIVIYILKNTKYNAQSDWATAVLLAREQMRSRQWFPDTWVYAQTIWIFTLNLLVIPFLAFTNNMLLARELAVIVQTILCTGTCYVAMKRLMKKNSALLVSVLLLVPMSTIVNRNFFYEATYSIVVLWQGLLIIIGDKVYCSWRNRKKGFWAWCVLWIVLCVAMSSSSAKMLVMIIIPFMCALIIWLGIKHKFILAKLLKEYKVVFLIVSMLLGVVVGLAINDYLKHCLIFDNGVANLVFSDVGQWGRNFGVIVGAFAEMYGLEGSGAVVSLAGVWSIFKSAVAIVLTIGIPIWAICSYCKLQKSYQQIFVIYSLFAAFFILYICTISDGVGESARYFLGIYINNMILAGICFDCLICENKYLRRLLMTGVFAFFVLCAIQYRDYNEIDYDAHEELITFLKEKNIRYGYAEYWTAGVTTVLSNGEVELVANETGRQGTALYWLCSTEWYEADYHEGDFCFVIKNGEHVDERYRQEADEIHQVGGYEVLVFWEEGESHDKLFFSFPQKTGDSYTFYGDNFYFRTQCGVVENSELISKGNGAFAYGQYCVLSQGTYRLDLDMEVTGTSGCSVEVACASTVFSSTWCESGTGYVIDNIVVPERAIGSEIRIMSGEGTEVRLKSITITKVK